MNEVNESERERERERVERGIILIIIRQLQSWQSIQSLRVYAHTTWKRLVGKWWWKKGVTRVLPNCPLKNLSCVAIGQCSKMLGKQGQVRSNGVDQIHHGRGTGLGVGKAGRVKRTPSVLICQLDHSQEIHQGPWEREREREVKSNRMIFASLLPFTGSVALSPFPPPVPRVV